MSRHISVLPADEWPSKVVRHTVTFVRHAEKAGPGFSADVTDRGRRDAFEAGKRIRYPVDLFLASPSPRTRSTAEAIRDGNGSSAPVLVEEQLAEPGLGLYSEFRPAMRAFFLSIRSIIEENRAETVVAVTHNYVLEYVAAVFGTAGADPALLSGVTVNLEDLCQASETL